MQKYYHKVFFRVAAIALGIFGIWPLSADAHEAYVLSPQQFQAGLRQTDIDAFSALRDPHNFLLLITIAGSILLVLLLNFWLQKTNLVRGLARRAEELAPAGFLAVRLALTASFFIAAWSQNIFGPEISLAQMPLGAMLRPVLFAISILIALGIFTEAAAALGLLIYILAFAVFGKYSLTYFSYFGELLVLMLFGASHWSLFHPWFTKARRRWQFYEVVIVRFCYGVALIYTAVSVKLLRPALTLAVINQYNLTRFHWLFPHDPLLIVAGAAVVEITIGLFIIFGFQLCLTVLVSLFYLTLSLFFFREQVWPHLMLYGISILLLLTPNRHSLDHYFDRHT